MPSPARSGGASPPETPPAARGEGRARRAARALAARGWFLVPQVFSRLSAIVVFALVANATTTSYLGAFAIATAVGAGAQALGPALVAKPLAAVPPAQRGPRAVPAISAAAATGVAAATVLLGASLLVDGLPRITLAAAGLTAAGVLGLEAAFWTTVFTRGARPAGLGLAGAYLAQVLATVAVAALEPGPHLVLVPGGTLAVCAAVLVAAQRPRPAAARVWWAGYRHEWLPYVFGSASSIALVQAIPLALAGLAGLAATSLYRAVELVFGPTNLAVSVTGNALLAREEPGRVRELYRRAGAVLALLAVGNGLVLALAPPEALGLLVGELAGELQELAGVATLQRSAMAVASMGGILLVPLLSARLNGVLSVAASGLSFLALVVGLLAGGLVGGLAALAVTELVLAVVFGSLLRRRARD